MKWEAPKGYGTDRIEETRSLCSSVRKIDRCRAWINSESLRMTGTCPCVIEDGYTFGRNVQKSLTINASRAIGTHFGASLGGVVGAAIGGSIGGSVSLGLGTIPVATIGELSGNTIGGFIGDAIGGWIGEIYFDSFY